MKNIEWISTKNQRLIFMKNDSRESIKSDRRFSINLNISMTRAVIGILFVWRHPLKTNAEAMMCFSGTVTASIWLRIYQWKLQKCDNHGFDITRSSILKWRKYFANSQSNTSKRTIELCDCNIIMCISMFDWQIKY